jgi:hypothetical protein
MVGFRLMANSLQTRGFRLQRELQRRLFHNGSSRPAFIVGCGRSGTTMLLHQLSKTWQVEPYNEDHSAAFENYRLKNAETIAELVRTSRAPLTLVKPILNTTMTSQLLGTFPEARFLFVIRQFDDVVRSSLRRFGPANRLGHVRSWMEDDFSEFGSAPPPEATRQYLRQLWRPDLSAETGAALYWLFYNRLYFDLGLDELDNVLLVQYERIVQAPEISMTAIAEFLGIRFAPSMAAGIFASSMIHVPSRSIDSEVRAECMEVWMRLTAHTQLG